MNDNERFLQELLQRTRARLAGRSRGASRRRHTRGGHFDTVSWVELRDAKGTRGWPGVLVVQGIERREQVDA